MRRINVLHEHEFEKEELLRLLGIEGEWYAFVEEGETIKIVITKEESEVKRT